MGEKEFTSASHFRLLPMLEVAKLCSALLVFKDIWSARPFIVSALEERSVGLLVFKTAIEGKKAIYAKQRKKYSRAALLPELISPQNRWVVFYNSRRSLKAGNGKPAASHPLMSLANSCFPHGNSTMSDSL